RRFPVRCVQETPRHQAFLREIPSPDSEAIRESSHFESQIDSYLQEHFNAYAPSRGQALGLLDANDLLRAVDVLDPQPHHLAGAQAAAIAKTEQNAGLEAVGDGQQAPGLVRAHHQRNLL